MICEVCTKEFKPRPTAVTVGYDIIKVPIDDGEPVILKVCPKCYDNYKDERKKEAIKRFKELVR